MADRTWEERSKWMDRHRVSFGQRFPLAGYVCYWADRMSPGATVEEAVDAAMDRSEREAAERAKAEQECPICQGTGRLTHSWAGEPHRCEHCKCPTCHGTGARAEQAATAARARSPVAALLDGKQVETSYTNLGQYLSVVRVEHIRSAIDQQCALWRKEASAFDVSCKADAYTRGSLYAQAETLRRCASDLSGSTGER